MSVSSRKYHTLLKQWKHEVEYAKPKKPRKIISTLAVQKCCHFLHKIKNTKYLIYMTEKHQQTDLGLSRA